MWVAAAGSRLTPLASPSPSPTSSPTSSSLLTEMISIAALSTAADAPSLPDAAEGGGAAAAGCSADMAQLAMWASRAAAALSGRRRERTAAYRSFCCVVCQSGVLLAVAREALQLLRRLEIQQHESSQHRQEEQRPLQHPRPRPGGLETRVVYNQKEWLLLSYWNP